MPIVLANLFVLLSGVVLGKWLGSLSQIVYLLLGFVGVPVFAGHTCGPSVFAGPTGGYLIGYVLASFIAGLLVEYLPRLSRSRVYEPARLAFAMTIGAFIIYIP